MCCCSIKEQIAAPSRFMTLWKHTQEYYVIKLGKGRECTDSWTKATQTAVPVQTADRLFVREKSGRPRYHNNCHQIIATRMHSSAESAWSFGVFILSEHLSGADSRIEPRSGVKTNDSPRYETRYEWHRLLERAQRTLSDSVLSHLRWLAAVGGPVLIQLIAVIPSEIYGRVCFQR